MKRISTLAIIGLVGILAAPSTASAQSCPNGDCGNQVVTGGYVTEGEVINDDGYVGDISSGAVYGQRRQFGQPDLFYNYYTQGNVNSANAQMYLSPVPVPPNVGHTYYTYQPFYPHHMLYAHTDRYHNNYDNGRGINRTTVKYSYPRVWTAIENVYWNKIRLPR